MHGVVAVQQVAHLAWYMARPLGGELHDVAAHYAPSSRYNSQQVAASARHEPGLAGRSPLAPVACIHSDRSAVNIEEELIYTVTHNVTQS